MSSERFSLSDCGLLDNVVRICFVRAPSIRKKFDGITQTLRTSVKSINSRDVETVREVRENRLPGGGAEMSGESLAQELLQVSGVQHAAHNEELQRV